MKEIRESRGCKYYFETGLYKGGSLSKALSCGFEKCFSLEIRTDFVAECTKKFAAAITANKCQIFNADSVFIAKYLSQIPKGRTMFFLDAHLDNEEILDKAISKPHRACPLLVELKAIGTLPQKDHVIIIDDARILRKSYPWGEKAYGNSNFIVIIKNIIMAINPNYRFRLLDGTNIKDDIIMAYIPAQEK
jgi:hypothetical protein